MIRQPSVEVSHIDSGVSNWTEPSAILNTIEHIACMQFVMTEVETVSNWIKYHTTVCFS